MRLLGGGVGGISVGASVGWVINVGWLVTVVLGANGVGVGVGLAG